MVTASIRDGAVTNQKLAPLTAVGLVANSATSASTSVGAANSLVQRDAGAGIAARRISSDAVFEPFIQVSGSRFITLGGSTQSVYLGSQSGPSVAGSGPSGNVAVGAQSLLTTGTSSDGTSLGWQALNALSSGAANVAVGARAGSGLIQGSGNIYIGAYAGGGSYESYTTRIGYEAVPQRVFIHGIRGVTTGVADGVNVIIASNGQLGTISSSQRFKHDVTEIGNRSSRLLQLRPTSFRYLPALDSSQTETYGLIAEEVAEVMPELIAHDRDGNIETVKYQLLPVLLLNEMQRLQREVDALQQQVRQLQRKPKRR